MSRLWQIMMALVVACGATLTLASEPKLEVSKTLAATDLVGQPQINSKGTLVASLTTDGYIKVWSTTGKELYELGWGPRKSGTNKPSLEARAFAFSTKDADTIFGLLQNPDTLTGFVHGWKKGELLADTQKDDKYSVSQPVSQMLLGTGDQIFFVVAHNQKWDELKKKETPAGFVMAMTDERLAQYSYYHHRVGNGDKSEILSAAVSSQGKHLLTVGTDSKLKMWQVKSKGISPQPTEGTVLVTSPVTAMVFSDDGNMCAANGRGPKGEIILGIFLPKSKKWRIAFLSPVWESGEEVFEVNSHHFAFSPDGQHLVVARTVKYASETKEEIVIWKLVGPVLDDSAKDKQMARFLGHEAPIASLQWIDNDTLATNSQDSTIRVWNIDGGETQVIKEQGDGQSMAIHRASGTLAASQKEKGILIFKVSKVSSAKPAEKTKKDSAGSKK